MPALLQPPTSSTRAKGWLSSRPTPSPSGCTTCVAPPSDCATSPFRLRTASCSGGRHDAGGGSCAGAGQVRASRAATNSPCEVSSSPAHARKNAWLQLLPHFPAQGAPCQPWPTPHAQPPRRPHLQLGQRGPVGRVHVHHRRAHVAGAQQLGADAPKQLHVLLDGGEAGRWAGEWSRRAPQRTEAAGASQMSTRSGCPATVLPCHAGAATSLLQHRCAAELQGAKCAHGDTTPRTSLRSCGASQSMRFRLRACTVFGHAATNRAHPASWGGSRASTWPQHTATAHAAGAIHAHAPRAFMCSAQAAAMMASGPSTAVSYSRWEGSRVKGLYSACGPVEGRAARLA